MNSFYAQEEMELLLNLLCQLQILELDSPSIILPQYQLPVPIRLPPIRPVSSTSYVFFYTLNRSLIFNY
ncbi:unnamed protein product [Rotaria sp. Silwood1]|nr:unnamed protein product [Rotaria sp. Silwood1]CAF4973129.1 unnamed protein product [Rotaria sp. Silwood1]